MKKLILTQSIAQRLDGVAAYLLQQEEANGQNAYYIDTDIIASGCIPSLRSLSDKAIQELIVWMDWLATQLAIFEKRIVSNGESIYFLNDLVRSFMFSGGFVALWRRQKGEKIDLALSRRVQASLWAFF